MNQIWDAINDGTIFSCPSLLASFSIICYADLKRYKFTYQFAFPVLHSDPHWILERNTLANSSVEIHETELGPHHERLSGSETTALVDCVQTWRYGVDARQFGFFLAKRTRKPRAEELHNHRPHTPERLDHGVGYTWVIDSLASYETGFFDGVPVVDQLVCFADPSTYPSYPGWMLRNLLILIRTRWKLDKVQILCYRDIPARRDDARSIVLKLVSSSNGSYNSISTEEVTRLPEMPKVTGWERNAAGKVTSKIANLGEYMDPQRSRNQHLLSYAPLILIGYNRLADQAVDLNLKLIKWRIAPELNLEKIKSTSCLLLGAGTLGSYVARNLMVCKSLNPV